MTALESDTVLSLSTIRRLPRYLRVLQDFAASGKEYASSEAIASHLHLTPIVVRKDLFFSGIIGKPRRGYHIPCLIAHIEQIIHLHEPSSAFLVGAGNLGSALLGYSGITKSGLTIYAAFDNDSGKIGRMICGKQIYAMEKITAMGRRLSVQIGILCVPYDAAPSCADLLVQAGVRGVWNFSNRELRLPAHVAVHNEDLSAGLAILSIALNHQPKKATE